MFCICAVSRTPDPDVFLPGPAVSQKLVIFDLEFAIEVSPLGNEIQVMGALFKMVAVRLGAVDATELETVKLRI